MLKTDRHMTKPSLTKALMICCLSLVAGIHISAYADVRPYEYRPDKPDYFSEHPRGTARYFRDMADYYMGHWIVLRVSHVQWHREPENGSDIGELTVHTYNKGPGSYALVSAKAMEGRMLIEKYGSTPTQQNGKTKTRKMSVFYIGVWAGDSIRASRSEDAFFL